ncbi:MAG: metallophosphoesterase, partial [Actinobacteria bacterium]|nr:metallophosphoesterase [Actinomycetota bacterium]
MPETPDVKHGCPPRPTSETQAELGFVRRPMVRWLDPHQLLDTAVRVVLSGIFSSYADSRELQALVPAEVLDRSGEAELWLDYVADLGDGWNSTYTVARLLATEKLDLSWAGDSHPTQRGRLLVMGGDQVYPVPKRVEYENRMLGPYRSALPCVGEDSPELLAIPGSHDWYDGLVNFTSVFCRRRSIGGWKTAQERSYFAVKLPHRWWLWGIDIQFGAYLDEAQLTYFQKIAEEEVQTGDRIVLCMAKEVESGRSSSEIYSDRNLEYIEREVIKPTGASVLLHLKSGRHHYCRYKEESGPRHHITSGGGGAFLHPTHQLPEHLEVGGESGQSRYRRATTFPSAAVSKRLRKRVWLLPPYNLPLAAVFGGVQVLLAFMLGLHLEERHVGLGLGDLRQAVWETPTAFLLVLVIFVIMAAMVRFAHEASGLTRFLLGLVHSSLQMFSVAGVMVAASRLSSAVGLEGAPSLLTFLGLVTVLGGVGGTLGMSGYLFATNCLGFHGNEAYAPLHHADLKHFLRLHIDGDGALTVYPIGIERVVRHWQLQSEGPPEAP